MAHYDQIRPAVPRRCSRSGRTSHVQHIKRNWSSEVNCPRITLQGGRLMRLPKKPSSATPALPMPTARQRSTMKESGFRSSQSKLAGAYLEVGAFASASRTAASLNSSMANSTMSGGFINPDSTRGREPQSRTNASTPVAAVRRLWPAANPARGRYTPSRPPSSTKELYPCVTS